MNDKLKDEAIEFTTNQITTKTSNLTELAKLALLLRIKDLEQENAELKNQIEETRTLNKDEVKKKILSYLCKGCSGGAEMIAMSSYDLDDLVDEICKLAIPKIDKEKIIAAIDRWVFELSETYTDFDLIEPYDVNKLANEIVRKLEAQ